MPHDDRFDKLEATNQFTDPGGTTHTGSIGSGGGVDVENTDGSALVSGATAIHAGTDLQFSDDGDSTATLDYTGSSGGVTVENTDGTALVADATAIQAGTDLQFGDDTDGTATLDYTGSSGGVDVENTDGSALVSGATAIQAGTDLQFSDDSDGTATLDYTGSSSTERKSVTQSGDGSATTFTVSHNLGATPSAVEVTPNSEDAMADFYVANESSTSFDIVYAAAPVSGTDNLSWYVSVHA